ncbi:hypothetical protein FRC05_002739 [Tulasnella sp. 425]|nr:hypothetical protein FRC05_002739 [Tulasnella sp. 425]
MLDELHQDGEPSHFGRGNELVQDESYRLAREIRADRFGFNFDPLADESAILDAISREISILSVKQVEAKLYKLNSYVTGGHFKLHQDTPKGENHIGTLLIGLPTSFSGGQLMLKRWSSETSIDWSTDGRRGLSKTNLPWVFFYADTEHEILPVTAGHRITIAYDIYKTNAIQAFIPSQLNANLDVSSKQIFQDLKAEVLENKDFRPNGGRLAFPSRHEYPLPLARRSVHLIDILKGGHLLCYSSFLFGRYPCLYGKTGSDQILVYAARQFGIPVSTKAVYKNMYEDEYTDIPNSTFKFGTASGAENVMRYPVDDYSSYNPHTLNRFTSNRFETNIPESISINKDEPPEGFQLVLEHCDVELEMDLIWIGKPGMFTETSTFPSYGNEPSESHTYAAAVTILEIPPYGSGCRAEPETNN